MRSLVTVILLAVFVSSWAQSIKPIEQNVGKLHISVDPRMELLSTIQILSNYKVIDRNSPYSKEIQNYFGSYSNQQAVALTDKLVNNHGFAYDAPPAFMLYLSEVPELNKQIPYIDYIEKRAGSSENLESYRQSIAQFAKEADFGKFWTSHADFYNQVLRTTVSDINGEDLIKVVENYFNEKQNSYNIIIAPLFNGHNYGPKVESSKDKYDIYSCTTPTNYKNGIPYVSKENLYQVVFHEFGHSFVNSETGKYPDKVAACEKLFEPIRGEMRQKAYGEWTTCVNEHIVRAVNIRIQELQRGPVASKQMLNQEIGNKFVYVRPLVEKLKKYETLRDSKQITFADFYPQLLDVLDSLSKTDYLKLAEFKFRGPINSVTMNQKVAWIYPTNDTDTASLRMVKSYVTFLSNRFKSQGSILMADSTALKTNLSEYGLMVYGTIESNLLLSKYQDTFPFKIKNHVLTADKEYTNEDIKFISCLPNPQNPNKGMAVYTALYNRNIRDINNVFHGPEDFIVFTNRQNVISKSFYDKTEGWKFVK
jgi:hypothetical protein